MVQVVHTYIHNRERKKEEEVSPGSPESGKLRRSYANPFCERLKSIPMIIK